MHPLIRSRKLWNFIALVFFVALYMGSSATEFVIKITEVTTAEKSLQGSVK